MPSQSYRITEPHPSVPSTHYMNYGRGGLGNMSHIDPRSITSGPSATGPASRANLSDGSNTTTTTTKTGSTGSAAAAAANRYFPGGRGGAGNMHHSERPIFSFDEELERQQRMMKHMAPVYHIGRGGAGNFAATSAGSSEAGSLSRRSSAGSDSSAQSGNAVTGVRTSLEDRWYRIRDSFAK